MARSNVNPKPMRKRYFSLGYYLAALVVILGLQWIFFSDSGGTEIPYSRFKQHLSNRKVEQVLVTHERLFGVLRDPSAKTGSDSELSPAKPTPWRLDLWQRDQDPSLQFTVVRLEDKDLLSDLQKSGARYRGIVESGFLKNLIQNWLLPFGLLFLLWGFLLRRLGGGQNVLQVGRNKAKIYAVDENNKTRFGDVAGVDEAKAELVEIIDFLKEPKKFTRLGAKLPRGVLLVGPPGTGKTLLARAVAGEAGVPFFSLSGSDFIEMFVGVGAARVRDLFKEAKDKAPCIIFIDELDAIGKSRSQGVMMGGHDERENTLNQLLVEMDGFDASTTVVLMGATNRPDVLDKALLRPGRFDRQVLVDRPDLQGREQILRVHTRLITLGESVTLRDIAAQTPGFSGADLANICNEAALLASRRGADRVEQDDFQSAIERVIAGLERRSRLINPEERRIVAYHECGHAIVGHFTKGADPVQKVSIVPRGMGALGYTLQAPLEDRFLMSRAELEGKMRGLLGGRAAEELVFGEVSTGAADDLQKVSRIAQDMVLRYGMSESMPNVARLQQGPEMNFLNQDSGFVRRSEMLEKTADEEVLRLVGKAYKEAKALLEEHRAHLEAMASALLEREVLNRDEIQALLT